MIHQEENGGEKIFKKYSNLGCIKTESVTLYVLGASEDVSLDKTKYIKVPAFLFLSLRKKDVMDTLIVTLDCIRQGVKLPVLEAYCARI
jgi:hypothetical protein